MPVTQEQATKFGHDHINDPLPKDGIVILFSDACIHCQHSLENTNFATKTSNGTPVKWIDINTPEGQQAMVQVPGIVAGSNAYTVGGTALSSIPATLQMQNGSATKILKAEALEPGDLDMLVAQQHALQPAKGGNTVPNANAAKPAVGQQR